MIQVLRIEGALLAGFLHLPLHILHCLRPILLLRLVIVIRLPNAYTENPAGVILDGDWFSVKFKLQLWELMQI